MRARSCVLNIGDKYSKLRPTWSICRSRLVFITYISNDTPLPGDADDVTVWSCFNNTCAKYEAAAVSSLQDNKVAIKSSMDKNRLKMNTTKTEFMFVWFSQTTPEVHHILVDVVGDEVM